jgi:sarcosine oxidase
VTSVVVVGGGVMGSAAAWQLAKRGAEVTLLEQFDPRHDKGASHGSSRIFRYAYADQTHVRLAQRADLLWRELERDSGRSLLTVTGGVDHGPEAPVRALHAALHEAGAEAELLSPDEASALWAGLRFDNHVVFHPAAGRLHADDSVVAFQEAAALFGATVRHGVQVAEISATRGGVVVTTTSGEEVAADRAVVSAGAWTPVLLPQLAGLLRTTQEQPAHFAVRATHDRWPTFIHHTGGGLPGDGLSSGGVYGLASDDGIKVGFHGQGRVVDPDNRDRTTDAAMLTGLRDYVRQWLPGVDPETAAPVTCLYTLTPDQQFIVDRIDRITVLAGFSGHGFKFASAVGELAAGLVLHNAEPVPEFALGRFGPSPVWQAPGLGHG